VNRAQHPRLWSFLNFLLWYLGSVFLFLGLLMAGILLLPSLSIATPSIDVGIIVANFTLVAIVAVRCKVGLWAAVGASVIGFGAMFLYIVPTMILLLIFRDEPPTFTGDHLAVAGCFVIAAALLVDRWFARWRRITAVVAATGGEREGALTRAHD